VTNRGPIFPDLTLHWNTMTIPIGATVRCINEHSPLYRLTGTVVAKSADDRIFTVEIAERGGGVMNYAIERSHLAPIRAA